MAARYTRLEEIHHISFDAPDDSNNSIQSCKEDSDGEISDPNEAEDVQNQDLKNDFDNEEMPFTSEIHVQTQNRNQRSGKRQCVHVFSVLQMPFLSQSKMYTQTKGQPV